MKPRTTLRSALNDPQLLGRALRGESWTAWKVLMLAAMGEALTDTERAVFKRLTGRDHEPDKRVEELVAVVGRRGGKSRAISVLAAYIAALCTHPSLVPGEQGRCLIIAPDQRQAQIVLDYVTAALEASPVLSQLIEGRIQWTLRLTNHIDVEVRSSDFRRIRGSTYVAVIADESAFWMSENSANPDLEILNAVRPGLATTGGPLFMISSPYARRGELWRVFNKNFGQGGDPLILVARGTSRTFNPTLKQIVVDRALERDAASASAEFLAEFRTDIESFVSVEAVAACVIRGLHERPPIRSQAYSAFADPSGGSGDSFAMAIGHFEYSRNIVIIDALREARPPFNPSVVVEEFARLLKAYGVTRLIGDRYAGQWPVEQFDRCGIRYEQSAKPKSDLFIDLLPLINSHQVHLLDHQKTINQLCGLERRTARGGRDSIDHPPGGHDDLANVVAGLAVSLIDQPSINYAAWNGSTPDDPGGLAAWQRLRTQLYLQSGGTFRLW
jgi:hypothetical protein